MKENDKLKGFLIKRFLLILVFVASSEVLINIFYNQIVYPWLAGTMKINIFMTRVNAGESLTTFCKGILWILGHGLAGAIPFGIGRQLGSFVDDWAGKHIVSQLMSQTAQMNGREQQIYFAGVVAVLLLLMLGLLLPYVLSAIWFSRMVTRKVVELEQEEQLKREEYDRRRNLLLSDVAHDLKTPMTTVTGYASALAGGQVAETEKQQEYLQMIYNKSMQMSGLITLLFEYVKLDSEGFALKKKRENITEILRESVAALYTDFEAKNMEVEVFLPEEPIYSCVDRVQFQRAINNLLNNAIKHNPFETEVGIIMKAEEDCVEIRICDNGVLISKETADYIFDPFVMGDESRTNKGGSGLGLSIVQKIISMHGGVIQLRQDLEGDYKKAFIIKMKIEEE
ncbi:sensor histidine kinase [Roseburia sp. 499]|uniref:sensor histidine kinase n=1 Tax=Roseburia sp. 499 TaxID=1261634 RepID=UPI000952B07C|nr:HAMP domain-containing sensor histidine kinase [Roseburia sp. 499]WVK68473.1 HAMP domain-containing sensor histidine kinase [Roseburia sp. 499]